MKGSRIKKTVKNILFSSIVFFLFIAGVEVVLRTTHLFGARISWAEPDPLVYYKFSPGRKYYFTNENVHPITGRINRYGFRDKNWSLKKPDNIYRIAVLGDSFVEAFQVESERTFLVLSEKEWNNKFQKPKIELMNFGRSGYSQAEELLVLMTNVEQFSPDMVILFFAPDNDIRDISKETSFTPRPFYSVSPSGELLLDTSFKDDMAFKIKSFINFLKLDTALIPLIVDRINAFSQFRSDPGNKPNASYPEKLEGTFSLSTVNPDPIYVKNYQLNKHLIKVMAEFCSRRGIRFMLVTINNQAYILEEEKKYKTIDSTFNPDFFEDDMHDYARSINIEYLGLQRIFRESYKSNNIPLHWRHWNYEGHKVVANALINKLETILLES